MILAKLVDIFCCGLVLIQGLFEEFLMGLPFRLLFSLPSEEIMRNNGIFSGFLDI